MNNIPFEYSAFTDPATGQDWGSVGIRTSDNKPVTESYIPKHQISWEQRCKNSELAYDRGLIDEEDY